MQVSWIPRRRTFKLRRLYLQNAAINPCRTLVEIGPRCFHTEIEGNDSKTNARFFDHSALLLLFIEFVSNLRDRTMVNIVFWFLNKGH
jgi:hypothetical protein